MQSKRINCHGLWVWKPRDKRWHYVTLMWSWLTSLERDCKPKRIAFSSKKFLWWLSSELDHLPQTVVSFRLAPHPWVEASVYKVWFIFPWSVLLLEVRAFLIHQEISADPIWIKAYFVPINCATYLIVGDLLSRILWAASFSFWFLSAEMETVMSREFKINPRWCKTWVGIVTDLTSWSKKPKSWYRVGVSSMLAWHSSGNYPNKKESSR